MGMVDGFDADIGVVNVGIGGCDVDAEEWDLDKRRSGFDVGIDDEEVKIRDLDACIGVFDVVGDGIVEVRMISLEVGLTWWTLVLTY
jgi:hypothetical protein